MSQSDLKEEEKRLTNLLHRDNLVPKDNSVINFECTICYEPLDLKHILECIQCEKHICEGCFQKSRNKKRCASCKSGEGFKSRISTLARKKIQKLLFKCPQSLCGMRVFYEETEKHWTRCKEYTELKEQNHQLKNKVQKLENLVT